MRRPEKGTDDHSFRWSFVPSNAVKGNGHKYEQKDKTAGFLYDYNNDVHLLFMFKRYKKS